MGTKRVVLKDAESEPVVEQVVLTRAIVDISAAMKRLTASGLNRKAIVVLVHDQSRIAKRDIELVLNNLEALAEDYTHHGK